MHHLALTSKEEAVIETSVYRPVTGLGNCA